MSTRDKILGFLKKYGPSSGAAVARALGISRQAVNKQIRDLVLSGRVSRTGRRRGALFAVYGRPAPPRVIKRTLPLKGLEEDAVFGEFAQALNLRNALSRQSEAIVDHAFTEILNNAIDHSHSSRCVVEMTLDPFTLRFRIRDFGIGLFHSIRAKFSLKDETEAMQELLKGKVTTLPERHSGEGIFFTSKAGDRVSLRSHRLRLLFDNTRRDVFAETVRNLRGTEADFSIRRETRRSLRDLFATYAPEEYGFRFEKTRVSVRLFHTRYVSRSEARRLVAGLEKFREVVLDFKGVRSIGQGFADEVFRVFQRKHPGLRIETRNAAPAVRAMIRHGVDKR